MNHQQFIIDDTLVRRLVEAQFPQWNDLPVRPVAAGGWDNKTFRFGEKMLVRMPSDEGYEAQVQKEQKWLPLLSPHLSLKIPEPIAMGVPSENYPWNWSIYNWNCLSNHTGYLQSAITSSIALLAMFANMGLVV